MSTNQVDNQNPNQNPNPNPNLQSLRSHEDWWKEMNKEKRKNWAHQVINDHIPALTRHLNWEVKPAKKYKYTQIAAPTVPTMQVDYTDQWIGLGQGDSIEGVLQIRARNPTARVAVLNFAHPASITGGYLWTGTALQEESLCVRTNLYQTLDEVKDTIYPIKNDEIVYTEDVTCFSVVPGKQFDGTGTFKFDVITCAALRNPALTNPTDGSPVQYAQAGQLKIMQDKIRMILRIAIQHKVEGIVLGAFGCGAFNHPPHLIAGMIKDALFPRGNSDHVRANGIKHVINPIWDETHGSANWIPFKEAFKDVNGAYVIDQLDWIKNTHGIP